MDGLGRPLQTVQQKGSPGGKDIIQAFAYDQFSREPIKYLPYTYNSATPGAYRPYALANSSGSYTGSEQYLFYQGGTGYVNTPYPYAGTSFEPSPLNRTTEQGAPGLPWQLSTAGVTGGGHTVQTDYSVNDQTAFTTTPVTGNAGSHMAALYTASVSSNQNRTLARTGNNATYDNGQLDLTISKDENWNAATDGCLGTVEQYKDKEGHILLKRTYNLASAALQMLSTYYVYDDFGNLAFVLPPGANPDNNAAITQATLDNLCYQYRYDERGRLSQKKLPGKGWEYTVYNQIDQPVATQDSLQRANNQWIYTKYDAMARVIISGIWTNGGVAVSRGALQSGMNSQAVYWDSPANTGLGYTILAWPNNSVTPLSINYYDVYTGIPSLPSAYSKPTNGSRQTKGLLTATKTAVLNNPANMLWTVPYYDDLGRNVKGYSQHYLGGTADTANYDAVTSTYNFNNQPTTTNRQHFTTASASIPKVAIYNRYTYDHLGRKLNTYEQLQNGTAAADTLRIIATAVYNEIGQLQTKSLHSKDSLNYAQAIAYTYNERGWLLSSSAAKFAMTLYYTNGTTPQYNGNIANQYWGTAGNLANHWTYTYDRLNRLTSGMSTAGNHENGITYDVMGNMKTLQRYAASSRIDKLTYTMISGTNQLQSVTDSSGSNFGLINGTMGYTYDGNGNMLAATNTVHNAQNKSFTYNLLNLPIVATVPTGTITYTYTAAGAKLRKVSVLNGVTKTTDYIGGIEYDGDGTTNTLSFVQTDEGKAVPFGTNSYDYNYYLSDNLGNTRYTLSTLTTGYQQDDYYPFGMDINTHLASPKNEYLYNKKELQEEFTEYDYGARYYDPVIGRWTSVDPLVEAGQENTTPYGYVFDDPIKNTDPDGRLPCCAIEIAILEGGGEAAGSVEASTIGTGTPVAAGIVLATIGAAASVYIGEHLPSYSGSVGSHSGGQPTMSRDNNLRPSVPLNNKPIVQSKKSTNKLGPDKTTGADHSTFKMDKNGKITATETYEANPRNPSGFDTKKKVHVVGNSHYDKKTGAEIKTPHVHEGDNTRPALPSDLPQQNPPTTPPAPAPTPNNQVPLN